MTSSWPPENIARITELADGSRTGAEIAGLMGISRMMVGGFVSRHGARLGLRMSYDKTSAVRPKMLHPRKSKPMMRPRLVAEVAAEPVDLMGLTGQTCRWPLGDINEPAKLFCGALPRDDKSPYCQDHCRRAYNYQM